MKKVLSFVLVLAMILGCTAMAFAAPAPTAAKSAVPFPDAADNGIATILKDLGVLLGDENGNVNLDKTISRAEFCTILLRALGRESVAKTSADPKPFTDFKKADWFSGYVMAAYNEKIADGVSKTAFDPLGTVTADQAVTFVVKALGYDAAHVTGTWPLNYRIIASDLGLLPEGFDFDNAEITRGEVFEVLFNALDKALVVWDAKEECFKNSTVAVGAYATMTKRLGVASIGAMYSPAAPLTLKASTTFANKFDASEFVGKRVELLQKGAGNYYGIYEVLSETLEGNFNQDACTSFAGLAVVGTPDIYVNGVMTTAGLALAAAPSLTSKVAVTAEVEKSEDGKTVTLYSIAYDLKAETVVLTTAQAATLAKGTTTNAIKTYSFEVSGNAIKEGSYVLEGVDALADLEGGEVVDVYLKSGDGKIAKLVVTDNQIVGKVTKIQTKKSVKYLTVDGTAYKVAAGVTATPNYTSEYALSLNADGEIAKIELYNPAEAAAAEIEWQYAFVLDTKAKASTTAGDGWANGVGAKNATGFAISVIDFADSEAIVYEDLTTKNALIDGDKWVGVVPGTLIKYAFDEDGEVATMAATTTDFTFNSGVVTPTALGVGNVRFAADVEVVFVDETKEATKAATYVAKTTADIVGKGFDASKLGYTLDSTKKIDKVWVKAAGTAAETTTYITGAAVTASWNEDKATYATILFNGEEVDYDTTPLLEVTTVAGLEVLKVESGKITVQAPLAAGYVFTTTKGISCDDYNVYTTTGAVATTSPTGFVVGGYFGLDDEVLIYVFNDEEGYYEVSEDVLEDVLKAAKAVTFYDLDKDGYMDTVVAK